MSFVSFQPSMEFLNRSTALFMGFQSERTPPSSELIQDEILNFQGLGLCSARYGRRRKARKLARSAKDSC